MKVQTRANWLVSKTIVNSSPDVLDSLVREYGNAPYRNHVNEAYLEADKVGVKLTLEEAMRIGQEVYEYEKRDPAQSLFHRERTHPPVIYYMWMNGLVKIGITIDLRQRFDQLHPQGVMAIEFGDRELEKQRHNQFAKFHSHGEWFHFQEPLAHHIADIREEFQRNHGKTTEEWLSEILPKKRRKKPV